MMRDVRMADNAAQDVELVKNQLSSRLSTWSAKGYPFLNYFGMQRFGTGVTHKIGKAVLCRQWKEVCWYCPWGPRT